MACVHRYATASVSHGNDIDAKRYEGHCLFQIGKKASLGKVLYLDGVARWVEDEC